MKKLGLVVAVLMVVAAPALATVNITCTADGNIVTVNYAVASEPNKVRAFALDITVDSPAWINDVNNLNAKYWVYPGSIVIVNGDVNDYGSPVASPTFPGTLGGLDTNGVTIEMGSLYSPTGDSSPNAPPLTGTLLKFKVCHVFNGCKVYIKENAVRGGVVLTNPALDPVVSVASPAYTFVTLQPPQSPCPITVPVSDPDGKYTVSWTASTGATSYELESSAPASGTTIFPLWVQVYSGTALSYNEKVGGGTWSYRVKATNAAGSSAWCTGTNSCVVANCLNAGTTEQNAWVAWRYPACWCYARQCRGDINGTIKFGIWVTVEDLTLFRASYTKPNAQLILIPGGICPDLNHLIKFGIRVTVEDLTLFRQYYTKATTLVPTCDLTPIYTGPYNWWAVP